MIFFDEIIIGSGPCAIGYLAGIDKKRNVAIISNDLKPQDQTKKSHPKLTFEGMSSAFYFQNDKLPITTSLSGLTVSWGGVLIAGNYNDFVSMYPSLDITVREFDAARLDLIRYLKSYLKVCINTKEDKCIITIDSESKYGWENRGLSLMPLLNHLLKTKKLDFYLDDVSSIKYLPDEKLYEISGAKIKYLSKKVVLAAGVPGNLKFLDDLNIDFNPVNDHSPIQFLVLANSDNFSSRFHAPKNSPISAVIDHKEESISVIYDPRKLSRIGLSKILNKNLIMQAISKANFLSYRFYFVQTWEGSSISCAQSNSLNKRKIFMCLFDMFKKFGVIPFIFKKTEFGSGFHYQAEMVSYYDENLIPLGGVSVKKLPYYHPTFMFMLHSYLLSKRYCNS